jgi:hypothetical protein
VSVRVEGSEALVAELRGRSRTIGPAPRVM